MRKIKHILVIVLWMGFCVLWHGNNLKAEQQPFSKESAYYFDGSISREVLERYLDRSVTAGYFLVPGTPERYQFPYREDDIRMLQNIGAKLIGRSIYRWSEESKLGEPAFWEYAKKLIDRMHDYDAEIIFQGCLFEHVSVDVDNLEIPAWVFEAFNCPVEKRNFKSAEMVKRLKPNDEIRWGGSGGGVPMINNQETQFWFYYLAKSYIDIGCEAFHLGQVELIGKDDPNKTEYAAFLQKIREYAKKKARRHYILLDGHTPKGGFIKGGVSLLDFNSFPLRIKEVIGKPLEGILEVGHNDALFCKSQGAIAPSGWKAENMPYLVEFDNFGISRNPGVANVDDHFCWGYDDITWLAMQDEASRNKWLWYAFDWIKKNDPNGHLQMCVIRMISGPQASKTMRTYFANTKSPACPVGYSQEETIKEIWNTRLGFRNPDLSLEVRVNDLIGRLTLEEKITQMMNNAPAIERLGIPPYNWWNECLHGVARSPYPVTSFPQAIAMAATWDVQSISKMAEYVSDEGRAIYHDSSRKGKTGIFQGLTYWSPNINIFRDPRWGRGQETYGEDPFLTGAMGASFVKGLQGEHPVYLKSSACAKHYAVHSGPEWNRHTYNAEISNFDLWDTYLPAFQKLVVDAKVTGVMCAYNSFFGQPCCGNDMLMMDILKKQWQFEGYVTSDCGAIEDFFKTHKTHMDAASASADAVLHGTDCECSNNGAYQTLSEAVQKGYINEKEIDVSLKRLFRIRFQLGMFDPDERVPYASIPVSVLECNAHKEHALKMARQSIVLLKNENNLLPLDKKKIKKIAVVGPNADDESVLLANYYGYPSEVTTLLEGIKGKVGDAIQIVYEKGINLTDNLVFSSEYDNSLFTYEGKSGFKADYYQNTKREGTPGLSRVEKKIDYKWGDGQEIGNGVITRQMSAHWSTVFTADKTGEVCFDIKADDVVALFIDGVKQNKVNAINSYYLLNVRQGQEYKIDIDYCQYADNAEITFDVGTLKRTTCKGVAEIVKGADVIIFAGGISAKIEGEEMPVEIEGFRKGDRTSIALPVIQQEMLNELQATGKPVVLVVMTGSAIGLEWESQNLPAILNAWYGGQAGGQAIADVLFGDYNPAGRLPVTFYKSVDDLPDFEDYSMKNRTYRYFMGTPVYPFGYGLSYTKFKYSDMDILLIPENQSVKVRVKVENTGNRGGEEVVQLYLSNKRNFVTPIRALKGFQRISLNPGENRVIEFILTQKDLSVVDVSGKSVLMEGSVLFSLGGGQPSDISVKGQECIQKEKNLFW